MNDDPRVLRCAANALARFSTRMLNPPRLPDSNEAAHLRRLQARSAQNATKEDPETGALLRRLWIGFYGSDADFSLLSRGWKPMGFQHPQDATSDIRGGGILSLEALVYMVERRSDLVRRMLERRRQRSAARGPYSSYPWACAGITLTRKLCEVLQVVEPLSGKPTCQFERSAATFWHVAGSREAFFELFAWSFACLERTWEDLEASYMDFGRVIHLAVQRTHDMLQRLPVDVVPAPCVASLDLPGSSSAVLSGHNHGRSVGDEGTAQDGGPVEFPSRPQPLMHFDGNDYDSSDADDDDEEEEEEDQEVTDASRHDDDNNNYDYYKSINNCDDLPAPDCRGSAATSSTAATADLLGLDDLSDASMVTAANFDVFVKSKHHDGEQNGVGAEPSSFANLDFFGEYGLSEN